MGVFLCAFRVGVGGILLSEGMLEGASNRLHRFEFLRAKDGVSHSGCPVAVFDIVAECDIDVDSLHNFWRCAENCCSSCGA